MSDKKRITVFKENYKILKKNNLFYKNSVNFLITFLFLIIKKIFKTILPNYIEEMILKIKYKDRIYKNNMTLIQSLSNDYPILGLFISYYCI